MKHSEPNRDLSNWIGDNIHIDEMNKAIIAVRVRGKEEVIAKQENKLASARAIMQKFVDKVDRGMARSIETYAEMKQWMEEE